MRWYEGGIAEAVSLSRKNNSIFVVYVEGNDDKSTELTKIIDAEEVSSKLEGDSFIAIKIEANSVPHQQFSEIYNRVNVPSIYFIGKSGAPLEIIEEANDTEEFLQKIDDILRKNGSPIGPSVSSKSKITSDFILNETKTEAGNENVPKASNDTPSSSGNLAEAKPNQAEPEGNLAENINSSEPVHDEQAGVQSNTDFELSSEEKIERAKALIEKKRQEKQQEEEEQERNKELERRKMGQDVQKLKRWQQDQELKNIIEEREKEKKEQLAARQRILAQIEQDKADRAARFAGTSSAPQPTQSTSQPIPRTPTNNNTARLQFKLPDGSSHTQEFSNTSSLLEIRNYIKSNLNLSFNNFTLATTFPRREFTNDDDLQTLQELELVPTAVVLILPVAHGTVASNPSAFTAFLWYLIAPFLNAIGYIRNMIFSGGKPRSPEPSTSQENKRPYDGSSESSRPLPKRRIGETSVIRRQGNVHRLTDKSDSDDENNTWNGNSTQQM